MGKMHLPSFYAGVLSALAIVATHDERVTFDEIVAATGEEELVKTARNDGAMKWSGLSRYGYGKMGRVSAYLAHEADVATWESLGRGFIEHEPDETYGAAD
jgi:hypothetical protein